MEESIEKIKGCCSRNVLCSVKENRAAPTVVYKEIKLITTKGEKMGEAVTKRKGKKGRIKGLIEKCEM